MATVKLNSSFPPTSFLNKPEYQVSWLAPQLADDLTLMTRPLLWAVAALFITFCASSLVKSNSNASIKAPYVGFSSIAWLARIQFFFSAQRVIQEGFDKYKDKVFKLTGDDVIVLPQRYIDELRRLPADVANGMKANLDPMQSKYTHLDVLNTTRLFVNVIKTKLTPQLGYLVPTIRSELNSAIAKDLPEGINSGEWVVADTFESFHRVVGRVSARVFGGAELRDNPEWLHYAELYLNNIFKTAIAIRLVPKPLKYLASWLVPCAWEITTNYHKAKAIILPYITQRLAQADAEGNIISPRLQPGDEYPDVLQYLIEEAKGADREPLNLASMVLSLSLATNHTTTMALTEAVYDLCTYPEYIPELREEVQQCLEQDGGWQKQTLTKMRKLDSFMKESQRMNPPSLMGYKRRIYKPITLSDNLHLTPGTHVEFAIVPIQHADFPLDGDRFDGMRYHRMRQSAPTELHKHQFSTTSSTSLHFGHGLNSCPGRFMASQVIKMVLATLLMEYDFELERDPDTLPEGQRPKGLQAFEYNFPNPTARLRIRRRLDVKDWSRL